MEVAVNREICTGCELCPQTCPDIFEMEDDGRAAAKQKTVSAEREQCAQQAAQQCPVGAIEITLKSFDKP